MGRTIQVLVVDDSAVLREMLCDFVAEAPGLDVAGAARDGQEALAMIADLRPDIVTLDVHMPGMDGLETLDRIIESVPTPVIMVSALTQRAADTTLQALDRGALDYVAKPDNLKSATSAFRDELLHKLRTMAGADVRRVLRIRRGRKERANAQPTSRLNKTATGGGPIPEEYGDSCIAIGISTGGPPALSRLFQSLAPPFPAIAIVQHMPANFTGPFAKRLDTLTSLSVKEAETGDVMRPNHVLVAPGGKHLRLRRQGSQVVARIRDDQPVSGHKPSVDVMMQDAVDAYGERCLGVIMTGMGHDGAAGCGVIRAAGGYVLGQDAASSDVYGMNKVAFTNGDVDRQFSLEEGASLIASQCRRMFREQRIGV